MTQKEIIDFLENDFPTSLQEDYDNTGLTLGDTSKKCTGILITLDITLEVLQEAKAKKCNFIISHHPLIFKGLKKITPENEVGKILFFAMRNNLTLYAIHTNLDNVLEGVSKSIADRLGLEFKNLKVLKPRQNLFYKLITFVPQKFAEKVRTELFAIGIGEIGNYSECSFNSQGEGTFKPSLKSSHPFVGKKGLRHIEPEIKIEILLPKTLTSKALNTLFKHHPYEEPAYDLIPLGNSSPLYGSGFIADLKTPISILPFLKHIKKKFQLKIIRHSILCKKEIKRIALCGGSGAFLIDEAIKQKADIYITGDLKYHDFFLSESKIILADIGHFESEISCCKLLENKLKKKYNNFAVLCSEKPSNGVHYFN